MRKLVIALVAVLVLISLLAAPVMAQGPDTVSVPGQASTGADMANLVTPAEAPELVPDRILPTP